MNPVLLDRVSWNRTTQKIIVFTKILAVKWLNTNKKYSAGMVPTQDKKEQNYDLLKVFSEDSETRK